MPIKEQVLESLEAVPVPATKRSVVGMNLVRDITISGKKVNIVLASTGLMAEVQDWVRDRVKGVVGQLTETGEVEVEYRDAKAKDLNEVARVIAVMSGKGGVGKSLVSSLVAIALRRKGYEVGILDADITGASIPRMFNLGSPPSGNESGILPVFSKSGIEVMSINLLLPNEDDAVIWRGPLIGKAITQFWEEVLWGKLDYLVVDLPPGTADAPLTVMQNLPISGIVVVTTPQDLATMVVKKAVNMAQHMKKPIIGVVENMSYLYVPEIDKKIELFGKSRAEEIARNIGAPLLGRLPIDPEIAKLCDGGNIEEYESGPYRSFAEKLIDIIPKGK
ncbi:MAG: Mrp/NBP35 family ATP-binding protein [Dehalococcoidales bacterium]|nr:Mrp/NBP35 family ATP-binding protein [Dehalococcoidales bacterium]